MDLKIFNTEIGYIIISAAMFNDLLGWMIFSVILGMIGGELHGMSVGETIALTLAFVFITLLFIRRIINKILPWVQNNLSFPGGVLNFILILGFLGAAFTEYIGVHAIFGAFIMGIAIGDSAHLSEKTREIIHQFVTNIFAPLFFVSIGLRVNFVDHFDFWLVIIILILSFFGKVIGCGLGAYWAGMKKSDSLAIGFGMNSRGTMEIILGLLALQFGLIHETVFVALVIMALFTSISSAPLMSHFIKKRDLTFAGLLNAQLITFTDSDNKEEIIKELINLVPDQISIDKNDTLTKVLEREEQISTGIANYLAIPHLKMKIENPVIAVAFNDKGINFDAEDNLDARIVILLLTPAGDNKIQLKLLAEIAGKFSSRERVEKLLSLKNKDDIVKFFKEM